MKVEFTRLALCAALVASSLGVKAADLESGTQIAESGTEIAGSGTQIAFANPHRR